MAYQPMTMTNSENKDREINDYYATQPYAVRLFLDKLKEDNLQLPTNIWENACGGGHISSVLSEYGYNVFSTDIVDRGYEKFNGIQDFLCFPKRPTTEPLAIMTNPPFKCAEEFTYQALDYMLEDGEHLLYLLRIQFLESKSRKDLFTLYPPKFVYVYSERVNLARNAEFEKYNACTQCFAWFVWQKGYKGETTIRWI